MAGLRGVSLEAAGDMQVAVLGGGLQGCCVAMALAEKGVRVTIFDRNEALLTRAAVANEGKIHLGFMYAGDPSLRTARMMMQGALSFAPFLGAHLGVSPRSFEVSEPAVYVTHRNSQKAPGEIEAYLAAVHAMIQDASVDRRGAYFDVDLRRSIRRWSGAEMERELNTGEVDAAFGSPEVAIDPVSLAALIRSRIEQTPTIDVLLKHEITSVVREDGLGVVCAAGGKTHHQRFDHVVNTLWDGRLAIDTTMGFRPTRPWIHRLKYGVSFRPSASARLKRSITVVLGPFGEVVCYANGSVYLTWYPDCLKERTSDVTPPNWPTSPREPDWSKILHGTYDALAAILPALAESSLDEASDVKVRGGPIVAWGATDIDDPASELHRRFEIGVTSVDGYHSIDPGKLTMVPFFASECADRITGGARKSQVVAQGIPPRRAADHSAS